MPFIDSQPFNIEGYDRLHKTSTVQTGGKLVNPQPLNESLLERFKTVHQTSKINY